MQLFVDLLLREAFPAREADVEVRAEVLQLAAFEGVSEQPVDSLDPNQLGEVLLCSLLEVELDRVLHADAWSPGATFEVPALVEVSHAFERFRAEVLVEADQVVVDSGLQEEVCLPLVLLDVQVLPQTQGEGCVSDLELGMT